MSSISSLVSHSGPIKYGDTDGDDVRAVQLALSQAGYRVAVDGQFGPGTRNAVEQFQAQHSLAADGIVGMETAVLLDSPHTILVATTAPIEKPTAIPTGPGNVVIQSPHDDTSSLLAFFGKPWEDVSLLVPVTVPFAMTYKNDDGSLTPVTHIQFHHRCADNLRLALEQIAKIAQSDPSVLKHVSHFSGSYNYRPVRGSSRLSCHAFGAALDFDADSLPLGHGVPSSEMPQAVVDAFKAQGFFWGGDYLGRKDPMHFQFAHE